MRSRKFWSMVAIQISGFAALMTGNMGGGEYVALATLVLGQYSAANVAEKRNASK